MNLSRRQLEAFGEPLGDSVTRKEAGRIIYGGGGGSTTTSKNEIAPFMEEAAKESLGKARALTDTTANPYTAYTGNRIAEFDPLQNKFFSGVESLRPSGNIGAASDIAGEASKRALGISYDPYQTGGFGAKASEYMDPYMQNVVDIQQREAQRTADIQGTQRGADAVKSGAFGGSRQAIMDAEAARNLSTQKGDIQARGLQESYAKGLDQFNKEEAMRESSRQFGEGLGLKGLESALTASGRLGELGTAGFSQEVDTLGALQKAGAQRQTQEQSKLQTDYEEYLKGKKYPYEQLEFMSNIMRGTPYGTTSSTYTPGPSAGQQMLGLGTSLAGAYLMGPAGGAAASKAFGFNKKGGLISTKKMKSGGLSELAISML
jgi:hypothetical protein